MEPRYQLMAHQEEGVRFLIQRRGGILAFEQGLGKTLTAIDAFRELRGRGLVDHMVVLCPNSLKDNWAGEITRFAPTWQVRTVGGSGRDRRAGFASADEEVVIVNYEAARADIAPVRAMMRRLRPVLVLDESHHVKNHRSLTSIAARQFAPLAAFRWLLTGTPVTNSPSDIHAQLSVVADVNPLGPYEVFMLDYGDSGTNRHKQKRLAELLQPHVLRRTKEECLSLPSKSFVDLSVPLPAWQRRMYDAVRDGMLDEVRGMSRDAFRAYAPTALTKLLRLVQIASNPALVAPSEQREPAKLAELDRILTDLIRAKECKVILWSYYVDTITRLAQRYQHLGVVTLFGGVPQSERQTLVRSFQEDPGIRLFIGNPAAAGTGFTLTAATYAIYETLTWRYDLYAQSQDRNHRIGQEAPVTYLRLLATDTIDFVIAESLARKTRMAKRLVGDEEVAATIADMTPEEFRDMLLTNRLPNT